MNKKKKDQGKELLPPPAVLLLVVERMRRLTPPPLSRQHGAATVATMTITEHGKTSMGHHRRGHVGIRCNIRVLVVDLRDLVNRLFLVSLHTLPLIAAAAVAAP